MGLINGNYGATASEYQTLDGVGYAELFWQVKQAAFRLEGASGERSSGRTFVRLGDVGGAKAYVDLRAQNGRAACVRLLSGSYVSEPRTGNSSQETQSHRFIELTEDGSRGILKVEDNFSFCVCQISEADPRQMLEQWSTDLKSRGIVPDPAQLLENAQGFPEDRPVFGQRQRKMMVVGLADGKVLEKNPRAARVLFESNWSLTEWEQRRAELGL